MESTKMGMYLTMEIYLNVGFQVLIISIMLIYRMWII